MHTVQFLGDGMLRSVLLLRQPLNPPKLGKVLADLFLDILVVFLILDIIRNLPSSSP